MPSSSETIVDVESSTTTDGTNDVVVWYVSGGKLNGLDGETGDPVFAGGTGNTVAETIGPTWGLHLYDFNLTLGNLVSLVGRAAAAYKAS